MNSEPRTPFWEALALLVAGTLIICGDNGQTAQVTDGAGRTFYQYTEIPGGAVAGPLHIAAALHSIKDLQADSQRIPNMALIPQWTDPVVPGCGELYYLQRPQTFSKPALPAAAEAAATEVQLKWEIASTPGSSYTWAMRSPAGAAIVVAPGSAVSDLVHIDNISRPGQAISMATSSGGAPKSVTITLVGPNSGGSNAGPRIFELTNVPIGAQPSLIVQHDNGGQELVIQNTGDPAVIGLRIQSGSNAANSATRPAVTIGAGAVVKVFPGDWAPGKIATAAVTAHYLDKVGGSVIKQALL